MNRDEIIAVLKKVSTELSFALWADGPGRASRIENAATDAVIYIRDLLLDMGIENTA